MMRILPHTTKAPRSPHSIQNPPKTPASNLKQANFAILFFMAFLLILSLSGCANKTQTFSFLNKEEKIDENLPTIPAHKVRFIADVSSIAFEWELLENTNIKGFVLYQNNQNSTTKKIATIKNPNATHFVLDSLLPQTEYSFQIATLGHNNATSKKSASIVIKTSFIDPVEKVIASQNNAKQVKLIWSPHPNPSIVRYIIQRQSPKGKFLNIATVKNRLLVEYFDENLDDEAQYSYRIIAQDINSIKSLPSEVALGKTRAKPPMVETLQASNDKAKEITLTWEAIPGAKTYEIYATNNEDSPYKSIAKTRKTTYTENVEKLQKNQTFWQNDKQNQNEKQNKEGLKRFYKVIAIDKDGVASNPPSSTTLGSTLPPLPSPTISKATIEDGKAVIEWEVINLERVKAYSIYRRENGKKSTQLRFSNTTQNVFTDKEMQKGKKYTYQVVSLDSEGNESVPSKEVLLMIE